jgi:hypothetical protein
MVIEAGTSEEVIVDEDIGGENEVTSNPEADLTAILSGILERLGALEAALEPRAFAVDHRSTKEIAEEKSNARKWDTPALRQSDEYF